MVIFTTGILFYAKVCRPLYVLWNAFVVVYKHFDRSLHIISDLCFLWFLITLGFKLKNDDDKKIDFSQAQARAPAFSKVSQCEADSLLG